MACPLLDGIESLVMIDINDHMSLFTNIKFVALIVEMKSVLQLLVCCNESSMLR